MFDGDSVYEWDNILRCKSKNGDWKYVSGTYGGISAPIVEQAWLGNLINLGNLFRLTGAKASELAQCLGIRMLINGMWDEKSHDWTLKVERKTDAAE